MSRKGISIFALGFVAGLIAVPLAIRIVDSSTTTVVAREPFADNQFVPQPSDSEDRVTEPLDVPSPFENPTTSKDLIVIQPVPDPQAVYVELATQKARLLSSEALERETQLLRRELVELQATEKLRAAESQLQQLIDAHPDTTAANRALEMLQTLRKLHLPQGRKVPAPAEEAEDVFVPRTFAPERPDTYNQTPRRTFRKESNEFLEEDQR